MSEPAFQALRDGIDRNSSAMLVMPATAPGEGWRTRFLGQGAEGIWIECPPKQQLLAETLQRTAKPAAVSFRSGEFVVAFQSPVLGYRPHFKLSAAAEVEAILLAWPEDVRMTQRRAGYRAKVSLDAEIKALAWAIDEETQIEFVPSAPGIVADLRDLSVNGLGLILRAIKGKSPRVTMGQRMRVELQWREHRVIVATRVRQEPRRLPDGSVRIGLNVEGLDRTIEGRRTLTQITQLVAELQRTEARRRRAG